MSIIQRQNQSLFDPAQSHQDEVANRVTEGCDGGVNGRIYHVLIAKINSISTKTEYIRVHLMCNSCEWNVSYLRRKQMMCLQRIKSFHEGVLQTSSNAGYPVDNWNMNLSDHNLQR